ncbi:MAG TPA: hypothetical protein VGB62_00415 [Allosphingosinicella sp.]|jgi:magnesium-transporting ATPase (P-type)
MSLVGVFGVLLGLFAYSISSIRKTRRYVAIFALLAVMHVAVTFYYHVWAQTNTTDSYLYYFDPLNFYGEGFAGGTGFVINMVQVLREAFGGSYLDYFLLFQASGVWALAFIMRIMEETYAEVGAEPPAMLYIPLFFPSLHFFTSSIGKDGPLVLAAAMMVWSIINIRARLVPLSIALWIMVLFRPHVALIALMAFSFALFFDPKTKPMHRIGLGFLAVIALGVVAGTVRASFGVDVTSAESVGGFFERQSETAQEFETGTAVLGASYPVRLLSLLFRPFFFDANSVLSFVASVENLFSVILAILVFRRWRDLIMLSRKVFYVRFAVAFAALLTLLLAYVYYNVGLGLRQRTMMFPGIIAFAGALLAVAKARQQAGIFRTVAA